MIGALTSAIMDSQAYPFAAFLSAILLIVVGNLLFMPRLKVGDRQVEGRLSLLVPARNEERCIERCLLSLLAQDHPDFEVIVLDDSSTDTTPEILGRIKSAHPELKLIRGKELPLGWKGKNWACWQLANASTGKVLLFTDADTEHEPGSAAAACSALSLSGAGLVSGMVRQEMLTPGEMAVVPLMNWAMMCFMPLPLAHVARTQMLSAACGQFMAFERASYFRIGGHEKVKGTVLDDAELARAVKGAGMRAMLFDATGMVRCRMYRSFKEALDGFTKNLFAVFRYRTILYSFIWTWLLVTFLAPFLYLLANCFSPASTNFHLALASLVVSLLIWVLAFAKAGVPMFLGFLYPLLMPFWFWLAIRSMVHVNSGRTRWKGRPLGRL